MKKPMKSNRRKSYDRDVDKERKENKSYKRKKQQLGESKYYNG